MLVLAVMMLAFAQCLYLYSDVKRVLKYNIKKVQVLIKKDFDKVIPIIKYLEEKGYITPKEAENVCDKSAATVRRYLGILTATGIVVAEGNTNNSIYRVKVM